MKAVEYAYEAASEFLGYARELQRNTSNREQLNAAEDNPKLARCYGAAFIRWVDLHSLLTSQVREFGREARARTGEPVRIGIRGANRSVIEAIERIGLRVRNAMYQDRSHPFEPDIANLMTQAQENTRRKQMQGVKGRAQPLLGWGVEMKRLLAKETPDVIQKRLGILTVEDAIDVVIREWQSIKDHRFVQESLRMHDIDFDVMHAQLDLEFRAIRQSINQKAVAVPDPNAQYIKVSVAAAVLGVQCGSLHRTLGRADVPLFGPKRGKSVDLRYLIALGHPKTRQLRKLADGPHQ